jgi:Ni,Fe-hydrogenase III component G
MTTIGDENSMDMKRRGNRVSRNALKNQVESLSSERKSFKNIGYEEDN